MRYVESMKTERIVIIGAGIAGAATAYFLARKGQREIVILEKERIAGEHSTGRNAAILRSLIPDMALYNLARESVEFFHHSPEGFSNRPLVKTVGLFIGVPSDQASTWRRWAAQDRWGSRVQELDPSYLYRRIPLLSKNLALVLHQPDEGVVDVDGLHQAFLRAATQAGAKVELNCEAKRLRVRNNRVLGVETPAGFLESGSVVMAAGAWGDRLAAAAGYPLPLTPYRRHLLVTNPLPAIDPQWPVVWLMGDEFYFRPESGGLLLCACDTAKVAPEEGERVDPQAAGQIAAKASLWLPSLGEAGAARIWAGMRTFAPDQRFVIGPDPRIGGLYWAAGLGGHGITCSPAIGSLAADWIVEGNSHHPSASLLSPSRLF
jgi:D-arginine dehydrogenase